MSRNRSFHVFLSGFVLGAFASLVICALDLRMSLLVASMVMLMFLLENRTSDMDHYQKVERES